MHNPGQDRDVVSSNNKSVHDDGQADTFGMLVDPIEGNNDTAAIGLANADLEAQNWNSEEEEGDQVRNEPLKTIVGEDDRGIAEKIAEANSTALKIMSTIENDLNGRMRYDVPWQRAQRLHARAIYHGHRLPYLR
jgi:hypothetical protein